MAYPVALFFRDDRRAGQHKLARASHVIDPVPDGIPEFRDVLPLVYQSWCRAIQKRFEAETDHILRANENIRVGKIENAFRQSLACGSLPAPFGALDQNGPHAFKLVR